MNYYVFDSNNNSLVFDTDKSRLQTTLKKFKPELQGQEIQETRKEIVLLNGKFVFKSEHTYEIKKQEKAQLSEELINKRNTDLSATDFYLMLDYPISDEDLEKIKAYRQQLRDLPQQADFPYVEYPKNPLKVEE